ncbi:uncharacterized protein LOC133176897 [Saccostrea echinata]|uniref:uncharacterized protein LOC133176897 n=1 Tax=Saccostrea echinata TaxID=191078 RepID=UPI002A80CBC6|nr:uncharacterized protein LOC133176897 [Saccostrea echinata]
MRRKLAGVTIYVFCVFLQLCIQVNGNQNYTFGDDCGNNTRELADDEPMSVFYRGSSDIVCNGMTFECIEPCKVCVSVKHFNDPDCAIRLQLQKSWLGSTLRTVTCKENKENKICHSSSIFIYLNTLSTKSTGNVTFDLLLTSEKDETNWAIIGGVIGGVVGGLILVTVITGLIVRKACKLRTSQGHIYSQGNTVPISKKSFPWYSSNENSQLPTGS